MTISEQNGNVMPSIPAHYEGKQSSKSRSKSTPDDWCRLISQNHIMPALFDHDFGGTRERGCTWCLSIWSPSYQQFQLGLLKYILYWHLCSTIALSHVIFWNVWTSRARLMYPVLSYQVVAQDHVHLLMNMTALMVGILRVEERGNEHASQAICIDSRSKLQKFSDWLKTHPSDRDNKTASQDEMCSPEWGLKKPPTMWMASWNIKAIVASQVCHTKQA